MTSSIHIWRGAAALALALLAAGCDRPVEKAAQARRHAAVPAQASTGRILLLPDSAIAVEPGSVEEQLARYLASPDPAPRTFRFGGAEFERWQSRPNPAALRTMYAMEQILRAYPRATVRLAGYTDNEGSAAANLALARARVDRLEALLVAGGIEPRRIEKIGRGAADFVAPNDTPANRARNRRIELTVTAK